jgi:hypothetical protein
MRKLLKLLSAITFLALPLVSSAAVPQTLSFGARIADAGTPVTGSHSFEFAFWDCDGVATVSCIDPANVLWHETQTREVKDGVMSAVLGADGGNPLAAAIFNGGPLWLEVKMDGVAFGPRMGVHAVPYAIRASVAEDVQCTGCVTDGAIQGISASKVSGSVASAATAASATTAALASTAEFATTASVATALACTGACVNDAAIGSVSGSKVTGTVEWATNATSAVSATTAASASSVPWSGVTGKPGFSCSTVQGSTTVSNGFSSGALNVLCPANTIVTGGGHYLPGQPSGVTVWVNQPAGGIGWAAGVMNLSGSTQQFYVYARCCAFQ